MASEITMPQLSDTMTEGTVVKWHRQEGDKIKKGEEIADVETDKATMPMESFESGTLAAILIAPGGKASVGDVIGVVATGSEKPEDVKKQYQNRKGKSDTGQPAAAAPAAAAPAATAPAATAPAPKQAETAAASNSAPAPVAKPQSNSATAIMERSDNGPARMRVSPLARRIAQDKNIDLAGVTGSGPQGRIVKSDVMDFKPAASTSIAAQYVSTGQTQVIPLTKMRSAIAKALQASKQNIPHFYETMDVDVESLSKLRVRLNELLEPEKVRLSLGDFIAKAVATALQRHPALNASFNGTEVTRYGDVHLGMAVAVPDGLIVPVLRNIDQMGLKEIRHRSVDLVDRARAQRLKQDEMSGATFTVSNLGTYGVRQFSAIINPPQVAILAVAAAEKRPVVRGDQIVARTMLSLTLSADHRVVDGATAADFLRTLKSLLEEPGMMLV
jgi:pyruvate dehydrogenase E2 component (dihydrolipoamide acetyltransferase)